MKTCPKCGNQLQDDAKFCSSCGENQEQNTLPSENPLRFCPQCGKTVSSNMKFCDKCGYNLDTTITELYAFNPGNTKQVKKGVSPKIIGLSAIFGAITIIAIVAVIIVIPRFQDKQEDTAAIEWPVADIPYAATETSPADYTFDDIVVNEPTKYISMGRVSFESEEANYYGEITIENRSHVEGYEDDIEGTYSLFVSDTESTNITVSSVMNGYYKTSTVVGTLDWGEVEYPSDPDWEWSYMTQCTDGFEEVEYMRGLSLVRAALGSDKLFASEIHTLIACVITKDEAVRYVQDGTLPDCLQGLTVTGLDEIFRQP